MIFENILTAFLRKCLKFFTVL